MVWFYELHYREKMSQQYVVLYAEMSCTQVFQIVGIFWNLWPEINCRVALTKAFSEPDSFVSTADKFVANGWRTGQPSPITLTMNGFTRNAKHGFNSCKWSNLAWSSSNSVTIYFYVLPLCGPANASSRKAFVLVLTLGKWQNTFYNMCLWKNLIFFWKLKWPNLSFRFTIFVITLRGLSGN